MKKEEYRQYLDKRVIIRFTSKSTYGNKKLIGAIGTVKNASSNELGVLVDNEWNPASAIGLYWFTKNELEFVKDESEDIKMEGYNYIAIVNLLEDYNKKDYAFALYDEDIDVLNSITYNYPNLVVVNTNKKDNRSLGIIKKIMSVEDYYSVDANRGRKITAEVVGIVNMNRYNAREAEMVRQAELKKKKDAIEKELEAEINKRKSVEYYEEMAKQYSDNPRLAELVEELKNLGA